MTPYGMQARGEVWAEADQIADAFPELFKRVPKRKEHDASKHMENLQQADLCEVRLIVATQPHTLTSVSSKVPDVMEMGLTGGSMGDQLNWANESARIVFRAPASMAHGTHAMRFSGPPDAVTGRRRFRPGYVELVEGAIGFDAGVVLVDAVAVEEGGLATVAGSGVDAHGAKVGTDAPTQTGKSIGVRTTFAMWINPW